MLNETYIHLPSIGTVGEQKIWQHTPTTWTHLVDRPDVLRAGPATCLNSNIKDLSRRRYGRIASGLARRHHWRALCYRRKEEILSTRWLALDIETTGLRPGLNETTVVGICGHATDFEPVPILADRDGVWWDQLNEYLSRSDIIISYNGTCFDIPFLLEESGGYLQFPSLHLDLRFFLASLGYKGGLKKVQQQMGYFRDSGLRDLDGYMAVILWQEHLKKRRGALDTLIRYCLEDVVVLLPMARQGYLLASKALDRGWSCPDVPDISLDDFHFDDNIISELLDRRHPTHSQ